MAHLVEQMFSVKETPWHGLGHIVQEAPTSKEALDIAGLNWTVSKRPIIMMNADGTATELHDYKAITRDSDNTVYNVMSNNYEPLQNLQAFEFFDQFVDKGLARYETAGSLSEGAKVWILASLNKDPMEIGKNDAVNKFLMLSNGHDGTMAVRVGFTPIRVVCANTLKMAHEDNASRLIRVSHSKNVAKNVELLRESIDLADQKFETTAEIYRRMAATGVRREDLETYVRQVFEITKIADPEMRAKREKKMFEIVTKNFETGRGAELASANGTVWGLYNAVTEYLSYERGHEQDTRLKALWFGHSAQTNQKALNAAIKMAS
jgi:phage/plasmid-like protein (TIGR03299 family)